MKDRAQYLPKSPGSSKGKVFIVGTSGWRYEHWKNVYYPSGLAGTKTLAYYATDFRSVELNTSFYRVWNAEAYRKWAQTVGDGFIFSVKAPRFVTHMKKLLPSKVVLREFFHAIRALGSALGPVLFQLPPRWKKHTARLETFLDALPADVQYAWEFRDKSWYDDDVYEVLRSRGSAMVLHDHASAPSPVRLTADWLYVRLHGPRGDYASQYSKYELRKWEEILNSLPTVSLAYVYFNNDAHGYAVRNALQLQAMIQARQP